MQDRGIFFTTLSEVRSRADLIVVFACEPALRYPRFFERAKRSDAEIVSVSFAKENPLDTLALWSDIVETGRVNWSKELAALTERIDKAQYTDSFMSLRRCPRLVSKSCTESLKD